MEGSVDETRLNYAVVPIDETTPEVIQGAFAVNAVSFGVFALVLVRIRPRAQERVTGARPRLIDDGCGGLPAALRGDLRYFRRGRHLDVADPHRPPLHISGGGNNPPAGPPGSSVSMRGGDGLG